MIACLRLAQASKQKLSIILTIDQWKSSKHKPHELAPKPEAVNQDSPIEEIQEKEEPVTVEVVADVQFPDGISKLFGGITSLRSVFPSSAGHH